MENRVTQKQNIPNNTEKKTFFQKIALILLDDKRKNKVAEEIIEDGTFGKLYRLQIVLSGIICTLWLLINSVPVIIWAMLIAPILMPIKITAFAITTGNKHLYKKGLMVSLISVLLSVGIATIITQITPVATLTSEIYARISPTMIDLFIALASGIIAFLSLWFKKLQEQIAGVAMATSLIPPLCVTGIGISFWNMEISKWSFLLFITNFVAIVLVWIVIFYAFGFFPTNRKEKTRSIESIIITIIMIIIISMPLTNSMKSIANDIVTRQKIENTTKEFFGNINKKIEIEKISYQTHTNDTLRISATIDVPSTTPITENNKNELSKILALSTEKSVNLDLNIVNIASVSIDKKEEISKEEKLQTKLQEYFKSYDITIIESKIAYDPLPLFYLNLFENDANIVKDTKTKIENTINTISKKILGENTNVLILRHQKNGQEEQQEEITYYQNIKSFIREQLPDNIYIEKLSIKKQAAEEKDLILIDIAIKSKITTKDIQTYLKDIQQKIETKYGEQFIIQASIIPLSEIYLP